MTTHTPGPWAVVRGYLVSSNVDANEDALDRPTNNGGIYVAKAQGPDAEANAQLIAAAPDLLAIAERILERGYVSEFICEERDDHMRLIAAIARAKGE